MANSGIAKEGLEQKVERETKQFLMDFLYLALLIGTFNTYRWLLMSEYHVGYFVYGYGLIEALALAKIIVVGESLGIGKGFSNKPLIIPTLYKTMLFALFVLAFGILEHLITGFLHGKNLVAVFQELIKTRYEILARILMMFVAFLPFFAFRETKRALRGVKLYDLFFRSNGLRQSDPFRGPKPSAPV